MNATSWYSTGVFRRFLTVVVACGFAAALVTNTVDDGKDIRTEIRTVATISVNSRTVGISDNDLYFSYSDSATVARHLSTIKALGVKTIRLAVPWAAYEPAKGTYSWAALDAVVSAASAQGLGVLGVVNTTPDWARAANTSLYVPPTAPADLASFMGALAKRYVSKMTAFEVWNEPNAATSYAPAPDPAGYTALLKAAYPAIKKAQPGATVIGGVLGSTVTWGSWTLNPVDFVQQMYAAGAKGSFDALSFHPYQYSTKFSAGASLANSPLNQVTSMRNLMVSNGDGTKKIWATEYGLPTNQVSAAQQSDYISDFLTTWRSLAYAGPAYVYTLVDRNSADTSDPESTFGIYQDNWTAKPAAAVVGSAATS